MSPKHKKKPNGRIEACIKTFRENRYLVETFKDQLIVAINGSPALQPLVHSIRSRVKSEESLRDKLARKAKSRKAGGEAITAKNILSRVNDLAGLRILHLHRQQMRMIDHELRKIFDEQKIVLMEVFARTWDDKSRAFFSEIGIKHEVSPTMYTSVHYVVGSGSKTSVTCEIQVRTLFEEVWGEIDHTVNYPHPTEDLSCKLQLETLAHAVMNATSNVNGIMEVVANRAATAGPKKSASTRRLAKKRRRTK